MEQKIIFFDIDGTLMNQKGIIPDSTKIALEKLKEAGHLRFVCTGRTKSILPQQIIDCKFDGYVMGAGTHIEYKEEDVYTITISEETLRKTVSILQKYGVAYAFEGPEHIYIEKESLEDPRYFFSNFLSSLSKIVRVIDEESYKTMVVNKLTVVVPDLGEKRLQEYHDEIGQLYDLIIHEINRDKHGENGIEELMPPGSNKGTGIKECIKLLGINKEQTIGVGDSNNDLDMLAFAKDAICMGNGTAKAKELSNYITSSIDEDGIYKAMEHFQLI